MLLRSACFWLEERVEMGLHSLLREKVGEECWEGNSPNKEKEIETVTKMPLKNYSEILKRRQRGFKWL